MSGWKGVKGCWPAILVCGGSFAAIQLAMSNLHGPTLVNVFGGIASLLALTLLLRFWQPAEVWRFSGESPAARTPDNVPLGARQIAYAWVPWMLLTVIIFAWGWPSWKKRLDEISTITLEATIVCTRRVYRNAPAVAVPPGADRAARAEPAIFNFNWLSATGTGIFLAAILTAIWLRIGPAEFLRQFLNTLYRVRWAIATIACMLALAFTTKYSGADATLGLAFTRTGWFYPLFAPLLGWLGVALTGSDTSANALFGSLQRITAEKLGINPVLIVASNSTGGVMGKMIDAQSIVVAAVATQQAGGEGRILAFRLLPQRGAGPADGPADTADMLFPSLGDPGG